MNNFNDSFLRIYKEISYETEDSPQYNEIAEIAVQWLSQELRSVDPAFNYMFKEVRRGGGGYPNRMRIMNPTKIEVFIVFNLRVPLIVTTNESRPGCVEIRTKKLTSIADRRVRATYEDFFPKRGNIMPTLHRNKFHRWIKIIMKRVFAKKNFPHGYDITYNYRSVPHNITIRQREPGFKEISIDVVPAIELGEEHVKVLVKPIEGISFKDVYYTNFLAIPKGLRNGGLKWSRRFTFHLINPCAELDIIWNKLNLRMAYCLFKATRDKFKNLQSLKSHIITAVFLKEISIYDFKKVLVSDIYFHMLDAIIYYLDSPTVQYYGERGHIRTLQIYWERTHIATTSLKPKEVVMYASILLNVYNRLVKISEGAPSTYSVDSHFKKIREPEIEQ